VADELSPLDVRDIGGGRVWLQVNQAVDWDVALDIMRLVRQGTKKRDGK
jgi:hypothetical protein